MKLGRYLELVSPVTISRLLEIEIGIKDNRLSQKSFIKYFFQEAEREALRRGTFEDHYDWLVEQANKWNRQLKLNFL